MKTKSKKALIISPFYYPAIGGAETQAKLIAKGLVKRGYKVTIITRRYSDKLLPFEMKDKVEIVREKRSLIFIFTLLIKNRNNDLILWNGLVNRKSKVGILAQGLLMYLGYKLNKKTIFRIPSDPCPFLGLISKRLYKYAVDRWFPLTIDQERILLEANINRSSIIPSPNTIVELPLYPIRKSLKIVTLAYCGRLINQKGLDLFVEALQKIQKYPIQVNFLFSLPLENPEEGRENLKLLNKLKVPYSVVFEETEVKEFFAKADIGIFTSRKEGAPNVVREMMSCGLPVIASNIPGCAEIIDDKVNGILFDSGSSEDLANKLKFYLKNKDKLKKIGLSGYEKIKEIANSKTIVSKLLEL